MKMRVDAAGLAYRGRTASIGFARGPFIRIGSGANRERSPGSPAEEALALRDAIQRSSAQIAEVAAAAGGEAAQILEFQVALLEDEDFLEPVFATIDQGVPADSAWSSALDQQIADYTSASDEYLQARSSDLTDLRDRVVGILRGSERQAVKIPGGAIVCADDLPPSRFLEIDWSGGGGLALLRGSPTSHVAMLARARGIPMVVQLGSVPDAAIALLDGEGATLELDPSAEQIGLFERRREIHRKSRASARAILRRPAATWHGERIRLLINIQRAADLEHADAQYADGIGLMRTEFLLAGSDEIAGRRNPVSRLRRGVAMGRPAAGDDTHLRCWRRQAGARLYPGWRGQSVSWHARNSALPVAAGHLHRAAPRAGARCGARKSQGHVPHGHPAGRAGSRAQAVRRGREGLAGGRHRRDASGAWNHGRGAGSGAGDRRASRPRSSRSARTTSPNMSSPAIARMEPWPA